MGAEGLRVRNLMTVDPGTVQPDDALVVASQLMRLGRIRHLPVVDEAGNVVGILSDRDLAAGPYLRAAGIDFANESRLLDRIQVREVMAQRVASTAPDAPLEEAAKLMNLRKVSCLPVLDGEELVGILTERDFVVAFLSEKGRQVGEVEEEQPAADSGSLSDWSLLEREFDQLRSIRDQLRVQLRLATMDAKDLFEDAEQQWSGLETRLRDAGDRSLDDATRVGQNFVNEIRMVYRDLKAMF